MKRAIVAAGLCAAIAFSAPGAVAQGFEVAPAQQDGGQAPADGSSPSLLNQQQLQQQIIEQARQQLLNMTPEQRQQLLDQAQQRMQSMTPEQRQQMLDHAKQQMERISPEQRQQMIEEARQRFESLSPEEQEQMKQQAQEQIGKLSPADRAKIMGTWGGPEQQQGGESPAGELPASELPPEQETQPDPQ